MITLGKDKASAVINSNSDSSEDDDGRQGPSSVFNFVSKIQRELEQKLGLGDDKDDLTKVYNLKIY